MIKNYLRLTLILAITALVTSCDKETAELTYTSPEGNNTVSIIGTRYMSTDALALEIKATTGETPKGTVPAELYADNLNDSTCSITWENNSSCRLTLKNWDETEQYIPITFGN
jgi:hypothetical protein